MTLEQTITDNASGPQKVTGDSGSIEQHSLREQIAVDKYLKTLVAAAKPRFGIKLMKIIPPGAE